jgi:RNA polymerase sigma-70 factor (ECF subfamily)
MDARAHDQDREAVRRVLAGDTEAFADIVGRWQGPLVNLAFRFCRDRGLAEDMAQEAFLRVFRKLDRWRDDSRFSTWLFAVSLNVYRSHVRRTGLPEVEARDDLVAADRGTMPPDRIAESQTHDAVRRAVARLPPKYRDALILVYFGELGVAGAAAALSVPEGTVKARLHRGRGLLRRRLSEVGCAGRSAEAT